MRASSLLFAAPLLLQGVLMAIDEFHYHRRRGLPSWERIGHPLDTLTVLICLGLALFDPREGVSSWPFLLASVLSCLIVTKDEVVHARLCSFGENWLHAVLFVLHPVVLGTIGSARFFPGVWGLEQWAGSLEERISWLQFGLTFGFGVFQVVYWNAWRGDFDEPAT